MGQREALRVEFLKVPGGGGGFNPERLNSCYACGKSPVSAHWTDTRDTPPTGYYVCEEYRNVVGELPEYIVERIL